MHISLNKQLDKEVFLAFRDAVVGGADFGKKITRDHPNISLQNYSQYIDDFYITHNVELENIRADSELRFKEEIEAVLFAELQNYFGHAYSNANYVCYLSIFDCNPRYLETKSFQVYYKRSGDMRKEVMAHEITHFAFYDFCHSLGIEDSGTVWELSEIFNVLFLNIPTIQQAIGAEELLFYPTLKEKLEHLKEMWRQEMSAKEFITESLRYLQSKQTH